MKAQKNQLTRVEGSFRDPSGFVFSLNQEYYRQINKFYQKDYQLLKNTGLYKELTDKRLLIPHEETNLSPETEDGFLVIKPEQVPFISYPYEWPFSMLKAAAKATLEIQLMALTKGLTLKDASAFNIQFIGGKPILIDTLSFEQYSEGKPWVAYRQFCQHFLAPLMLIAYKNPLLGTLSREHLDGVPLELATSLLPQKTKLNPGYLVHLFLHAQGQQKLSGQTPSKLIQRKISKNSLTELLISLKKTIESIQWQFPKTNWSDYYEHTNYSNKSFSEKQELINNLTKRIQPKTTWDLGANTGLFSQLAAQHSNQVISLELDPVSTEIICQSYPENNILPLINDLTNPTPGLGWQNKERFSLFERGPADLVMALALIHHLVLTNNLPLEKIAKLFSQISKHLIIEYVDKKDSNAQRLLALKPDTFTDYTKQSFEYIFTQYFSIEYSKTLSNTSRTIYHLKSKERN